MLAKRHRLFIAIDGDVADGEKPHFPDAEDALHYRF
jgi:hypothetical protein